MDDAATVEQFVDSLRRRVRAMNTLWERAVSDLTFEQINHQERAGVLPMAFSFSHFLRMEDQSVSGAFLGQPPLWVRGGWAAKIWRHGRRARPRGIGRGDGGPAFRRPRRLEGLPGAGDRADLRGAGDAHRGAAVRGAGAAAPAERAADSTARSSSGPTARSGGSRCSSASSTSMACATWARSSTAARWSGSEG